MFKRRWESRNSTQKIGICLIFSSWFWNSPTSWSCTKSSERFFLWKKSTFTSSAIRLMGVKYSTKSLKTRSESTWWRRTFPWNNCSFIWTKLFLWYRLTIFSCRFFRLLWCLLSASRSSSCRTRSASTYTWTKTV